MITGTLSQPTPAIWDTTIDYDEGAKEFYARSDIDHKVLVRPAQAIWVNTETGERKTDRKNWKP